MFFYVITKNLNWKILTRNLVTFKRGDVVQDEKFEYCWGSLKNQIFRGGFTKKQYIWGDCVKRGAWTVCRFKGGAWQKRGGWCF